MHFTHFLVNISLNSISKQISCKQLQVTLFVFMFLVCWCTDEGTAGKTTIWPFIRREKKKKNGIENKRDSVISKSTKQANKKAAGTLTSYLKENGLQAFIFKAHESDCEL